MFANRSSFCNKFVAEEGTTNLLPLEQPRLSQPLTGERIGEAH